MTGPAPLRSRRAVYGLAYHWRILLLYSALALVFTWPLARHFTTHMPGNGIDDPALGWNLWWIKARLVDQLNLDIFHVDWLFHPIQINLAFYTLTPLNGLISVPLQTAFSLTIANNLVLLSSFVLSGYGVFLLVKNEILTSDGRVEHSPLAGVRWAHHSALFAGLLYAFAANKLFYAALGQYNIASSQWIPFCALYVLRMGRSPTRAAALRNAALAGLFLVFQAWAELTYASFLLLFIAIYFSWPLATRHSPLAVLPFVLLALLTLLGLTPFLWAMLPDLRAEGDFFTSGGGFSDVYSADLAGYLVPTRLHWLFGDWVSKLPFPNDVGQQVYIGYSVLVVVLVAVIYATCHRIGSMGLRRRSQPATRPSPLATHHSPFFWLTTTVFFWWMTLGPRLRWWGQETTIPGPFALISLLPFFNGNRYPSRYSVMVLLGVAVLVGIGLLTMGNWRLGRQSKLLLVILCLCFAAEHLSIPLPLNDFHVPEIYQKLATVPGDFAVLELPTGWRNGARVLGKSDKLIMLQQWYQTVHGKRRLGGNTSRNPPDKFQYFTQAPLIGDLIALMNADPNAKPPDNNIAQVVLPMLDTIIRRNRVIAPQVLDLLDVQYVTLHVEKATPALVRFVEEALPVTLVDTWQGRDWAGAAGTLRLYQVNPLPPPSAWGVDLATPMGNLHLGEGWSSITAPGVTLRYAIRPKADLLLNLPASGGRLELDLTGIESSGFALTLNGFRLTPSALQWVDGGCSGGPNVSPLRPASNGASLLKQVYPWQTRCRLVVDIPAQAVRAGTDRLTLHFTATAPAITNLALALNRAQPEPGQTSVRLYPGRTLVAQSAGKAVGDFAHIYWNGEDIARHQRGYNLVAIARDPAAKNSYVVRDSAVFDTLSSPDQSAAMAAWLQQWPTATLIAGAVQDEASLNLGQDAVDALAQIGVRNDLRGKFRWSHAFIGVVGAPPGAAVEAAGLLQPATAFVGAPVEGASVYGGVGQLRFTAQP